MKRVASYTRFRKEGVHVRHNRLLILLKKIIAMPQMHYWELGLKMNEPTNVLMQDLATLNELLAKNDFPTVSVDPEKYTVPKSLIAMEDALQKVFASPQIYLDEEERMYMLYLYTFIRKDFISNFHYQDLLKVSKNTTLADIKRLRCKLSEYGTTLEYQRSRGYFLEGNEADKRRMAFHSISQLLRHASGNWALNYIAEDWQERSTLSRSFGSSRPTQTNTICIMWRNGSVTRFILSFTRGSG